MKEKLKSYVSKINSLTDGLWYEKLDSIGARTVSQDPELSGYLIQVLEEGPFLFYKVKKSNCLISMLEYITWRKASPNKTLASIKTLSSYKLRFSFPESVKVEKVFGYQVPVRKFSYEPSGVFAMDLKSIKYASICKWKKLKSFSAYKELLIKRFDTRSNEVQLDNNVLPYKKSFLDGFKLLINNVDDLLKFEFSSTQTRILFLEDEAFYLQRR